MASPQRGGNPRCPLRALWAGLPDSVVLAFAIDDAAAGQVVR
jgi:hypothetical protein